MRLDLKKRAIHGGFIIAVSEWLSYAIRAAAIIVLARLLLPEHFGLIAMITAVTTVAERFKDLGLDVPTIQKKELRKSQINSLFWLNSSIGLCIMGLIALMAPILAWFYGDSRLTLICIAFSLNFGLGGLAIQHQALLRRRMQFGRIAIVKLSSTVGAAVVGVFLAFHDFGYWALVWKDVFRALTVVVGMWMACDWRPGRPAIEKSVFGLLRLGGHVTGFNVVFFSSRSVDQLLLGKLWGAVALGYYRQAHQLLLMPVNLLRFPLDFVMMPILSRLQSDPTRYRRYYLNAMFLLSFVWMPSVVYLGFFSLELVPLALGENWYESGELFQILAIAVLIEPLAGTVGSVMVSRGETARYFRWGVWHSILVIAAFSVGVGWGSHGVAKSYVLYTYVSLIPSLLYGLKNSGVSIGDFFRAISYPMVACVASYGALAVYQLVGSSSIFERLGIGAAVCAISYLVVFVITPAGRSHLRQSISWLAMLLDSPFLNRVLPNARPSSGG